MDKNAITLGLQIGRILAGQRRRKPVAYLYNGKRMPKLPDDLVSKYKCVLYDANYNWFLFLQRESHLDTQYDDGAFYLGPAPGEEYAMMLYHSDSEKLGDPVEKVNTANSTLLMTSAPFWSNYDIKNADGSLYLEASDPVPVYE